VRDADPDRSGGYDPLHYETLSAAQDRHFWFAGRLQAIEAALAPVVSTLPDGYRVLEVGCGTGHVLAMLERLCAGGHVVGMDLLWEGLPYARRRTGCPLVQGTIAGSPFAVRFDVIGLFDVVEHVADDTGFLAQHRALLTTGGALMLTVPAHQALWSTLDEQARHCRRYSEDSLRALLERSGYRVDYLTQFMGSLYPLMWLSRQRPRWRRPADPLKEELRIVPGLNAVLAAILRWEARRFIARGRRLPIGTSLLAMARPVNAAK